MRRGQASSIRVFLMVISPFAALVIGYYLHWAYVKTIGDSATALISDVDDGLETLRTLQREVVRLRKENTRIATENIYYRNLTAENARLQEMLNFKTVSPFRLQACKVIGRKQESWWSSLQVNIGWEDDVGLMKDLPVVSPRGVVGKTGEVYAKTTEVILMVNPNCKIAATLETTQEHGIVIGGGSRTKSQPQSKMTYIPRAADLGVGERVFTSGAGGVFPPGLFLGTVAEVKPLSAQSNFGLYRELWIDPAIDLTQLEELFIVMGSK
jgi:rod shape-determining protein MreC